MSHSTPRGRVCVPAGRSSLCIIAILMLAAHLLPLEAHAQPPMLGTLPDPTLGAQQAPPGADTLFFTDFTKTNTTSRRSSSAVLRRTTSR